MVGTIELLQLIRLNKFGFDDLFQYDHWMKDTVDFAQLGTFNFAV